MRQLSEHDLRRELSNRGYRVERKNGGYMILKEGGHSYSDTMTVWRGGFLFTIVAGGWRDVGTMHMLSLADVQAELTKLPILPNSLHAKIWGSDFRALPA